MSVDESASLDDIDKKLLLILQQDAKTPYTKISEEIGISEATVHLRIKRLLKIGVIRGFRAIVDPEKIGLTVKAFLGLKATPGRDKSIEEELKKIPCIYEIHWTTGRYNLLLKIITRDVKDLVAVMNKIGGIPGVNEIEVLSVLKTVKEDTRMNIPAED